MQVSTLFPGFIPLVELEATLGSTTLNPKLENHSLSNNTKSNSRIEKGECSVVVFTITYPSFDIELGDVHTSPAVAPASCSPSAPFPTLVLK